MALRTIDIRTALTVFPTHHRCIFVLAIVCLGLMRTAGAARGYDYTISTTEALLSLSVSLCFGDRARPEALRASSELARRLGRIETRDANGQTTTLRMADNIVRLPGDLTGCVHYDVALPPGHEGDRRAAVHRHNGAVMFSLDRFALTPSSSDRWESTRLVFRLPPEVGVSAPGIETHNADGDRVFTLRDRPHSWHGDIVLGQMSTDTLVIGGSHLRVSVVGRSGADQRSRLKRWLSAGADALTGVYGRFPVDQVQVLIVPLGRDSDPVPWGEVVRGGGDAVHLYVDGTRTLEELNANWVLCHELSHLLHPYVAAGGSWLPEGIASYYQNVLRARAGLITAQTAWRKLNAGFVRGLKQTTGERSLVNATRAMMRRGEYMRVYWSGAAMALIADVELREQSGGTVSLDTILDQLSRCCLPATRRWDPGELMAEMDRIAGSDVFMRLYEDYVRRPVFPDVRDTYRALGIDAGAKPLDDGTNRDAAKLRSAIMGGD